MACTASRSQPGGERPRLEVADVFRRFGSAYRAARRLTPVQAKVMRAVETCRTAALGGHEEVCASCGHRQCAYNSCRNRHCPKCQSLAKAQWLENRKAELLPVPYFHCVFTLPHDLNALVLCNRRAMLGLLFEAAGQTLLEFGRNNLGGKVGFTMVLHTWDQLLNAHFHLHCVIPSGALSTDGERWVMGSSRFLFPVAALSRVFRGKLLSGLSEKWARGQLTLSPSIAELADPEAFSSLLGRLRGTDWVVYAKRPFAGPEQVLGYLGRYTHRVAISNHRILGLDDEGVSFSYRDRRHGNEVRVATVAGDEFIRRFLLHTLPAGFVRIRHFGFLASRCKGKDLPRCRQLLGQPEPPPRPRRTTAEWVDEHLGLDVNRCPVCGQGPLLRIALPLPTGARSCRSPPRAVS
jgi:Putative transposase/Transposase zinc-binding domain